MKNLDAANAQYTQWKPIWQKCRDAIEGQEAIHAGNDLYLQRLSNQSPNEYESYKTRAVYFNACGRTLDGMTGLIFRKPPALTYPTGLQSMIDDIDLSGTDFTSFSEFVVDELCKVSRVGLLVDYPSVQTVGLTMAQAQSIGLRPYATMYKTESILDWRYERINNAQMLSMVKLYETAEVQVDEITYEVVPQIRVLDLLEGIYRVRVYRKSGKNGSEWAQYGEDIFPMVGNSPLNKIPFTFISVNGVDSDIKKPVLLDLVNMNISHYRSTADYEHGLHFTGLPTPVIWGAVLDEGQSISLGSTQALIFNDPAGHAEFLEFQGSGLTQIRQALQDKQDMMALLGSKILAADKRAVEAAETAEIHRASENSVLASIANAASNGLTKVLKLIAEWSMASGDVKCQLNTDYMPTEMSPQMFQQLTQAYLSGSISYETYFYKLQQGEIIRSDVNIDDERELLEPQDINLNDGNV